MINHFATLGLDAQTASHRDCRDAWRRAARDNHPDRFQSSDVAGLRIAQERIREINTAWEALKTEAGFEVHRKRILDRAATVRPAKGKKAAPVHEDSEVFGPRTRGAMEAILIEALRAERKRARARKLKAAATLRLSQASVTEALPELHIPDGMVYTHLSLRVLFPSDLKPGLNILALPGLKWNVEKQELGFSGSDCSTHDIRVGSEGPSGIYSVPADIRGWTGGPNIIFSFDGNEPTATDRLAAELKLKKAA